MNIQTVTLLTLTAAHIDIVYISCGPHAESFRIVFLPRHQAQQIVLTECSFEFLRR